MEYTLRQRIVYAAKRHAISIAALIVGVLGLLREGNDVEAVNNVNFVIMKLIGLAMFVSSVLLVSKFAFPKLNIQEKINEGNIAVAVFAAAVVIALSRLI
jgi:uncharacterized membrane protein YjfL (UPF0719 family)